MTEEIKRLQRTKTFALKNLEIAKLKEIITGLRHELREMQENADINHRFTFTHKNFIETVKGLLFDKVQQGRALSGYERELWDEVQ